MNETEFDARVRALEGRLYHIAHAMLRSDADCADAMQNAVFAAWRRLGTLKNADAFEPWLCRILVYTCRDAGRAAQRRKHETPLELVTAAAQAQPRDLDLHAALRALPEKYRLPVILHHANGLSMAETAQALRLPVTTAKGRVRQGMLRLRTILEEEKP